MHKIFCREYYAYKTMHIILSIKYFKQVYCRYKVQIAIAACDFFSLGGKIL